MRKLIPTLLAVCLLGTLIVSIALAEESRKQYRLPATMHRFKGHGAEYWHWQYRVEKHQHMKVKRHLARVGKGFKRDSFYAISLASRVFGVPYWELRAVASCETGGTFDPYARNSSSSASGLFQFLDSTWASQGIPGFSVFDPVANALATARIVARQGWRQWVCKP